MKQPITRNIFLTSADMKRLEALVESARAGREDLRRLQQELALATIMDAADLPADVITMNSQARLQDVDSGEEMTYTLVFPDRASVEEDRISVLAPIGTAMLGQREGDEFEWEVPGGKVRLRVIKVLYQPEAAGHHHL